MNLVNDWKERAEKLGVSLAYLAGVADVDRSWIERLKVRLPKGVQAVIEIEDELKRLEGIKESEKMANPAN